MDAVTRGTTIHEYIDKLVKEGELDPKCRTCQDSFYPYLVAGHNITDIFAPRHKARSTCKSGKHPHCTCDSCF